LRRLHVKVKQLCNSCETNGGVGDVGISELFPCLRDKIMFKERGE